VPFTGGPCTWGLPQHRPVPTVYFPPISLHYSVCLPRLSLKGRHNDSKTAATRHQKLPCASRFPAPDPGTSTRPAASKKKPCQLSLANPSAWLRAKVPYLFDHRRSPNRVISNSVRITIHPTIPHDGYTSARACLFQNSGTALEAAQARGSQLTLNSSTMS
jgi:hypothetical protein